ISEISYNDYEYEARNLISLKCPISIISYIVKNNLYFMVKINKYLDGKRLIHSINVAELSYKIALSNNLDNPDLYFIAGLLHDLGKHVSNKEKISIMERFYRKFINIPSFSYHQFAGAYKAKALFPNLNDSVYKAILTHATGDSSMNLMQRIVYASDKIEPSRGYDSTEMINLCLKNIEEGFIRVLKENIKFLIASDCDIKNVLTDRCVNYYLN
ncbi:MAG: bis(5'-nucleosyl)-tetraphosphatase (symmetrical) YqeK, partial [Bacilli bacterium]